MSIARKAACQKRSEDGEIREAEIRDRRNESVHRSRLKTETVWNQRTETERERRVTEWHIERQEMDRKRRKKKRTE